MNRLVVLISGGGSNLQALIDAIAGGTLSAGIGLVVSNRADAFGLERAKQAGIETLCLPLDLQSSTRVTYDSRVARHIAKAGADLIILAGWMHVFSPAFLDRFPGKVINLHPALPGAFPGTRAIERALDAFKRGEIAQTGVMVHEVIAEIDAGPVLGTRVVPIEAADTVATLSARMHTAEHELLVEVVRGMTARRVHAGSSLE